MQLQSATLQVYATLNALTMRHMYAHGARRLAAAGRRVGGGTLSLRVSQSAVQPANHTLHARRLQGQRSVRRKVADSKKQARVLAPPAWERSAVRLPLRSFEPHFEGKTKKNNKLFPRKKGEKKEEK